MPKTSIEWTDFSWPVLNGCRRASPGCQRCYAERLSATRLRHTERYKGLAVYGPRGPGWTGESRLDPRELEKPLRMRKPQRIFVCDMGDLFYEENSDDDILRVFNVIRRCPHHTFQILTKRAERMRDFCTRLRWDSDGPGRMWLADSADGSGNPLMRMLKRVWLGISAEDQQRADERIPYLLATPAAVRFVSAEPLLGPIDLKRYAAWPWFCERCQVVPETNAETHLHCHDEGRVVRRTIDWVIVGGESGPGARPCNVAWIRSIVEQCKTAGVAAFVKQFGALPVFPEGAQRLIDRKGGDPAEWPEDLRVREMPAGPMR